MNSQDAIFLSATLLQIGATVVFILCAKLLNLSKINAFTVAFTLIVIRRVVVFFMDAVLPAKIQQLVSYADIYLIPILFSFLLFIGTVQFYVKLRKYFIVRHK